MSVLPVGFGSSGSSAIDTGDIPASLRFRRSASASITTSTNPATTSTYFCLFKQGALGAINPIFDGNIKINANNTITAFGLTTTAVARDPTSFHWIHVSNNGLVFDGVNLGAVTTSAITGLRLGYDGTNYADMYLCRACVVSGTSLPYTDFVTFNTTTNESVVKSKSAIKALVDDGDAESSMYEFDDATSLTTLGYDASSKTNNATLNNFSLTAGPNYDHMLDVPGNSFAVLSPIAPNTSLTASTCTDGNLVASASAANTIRKCTVGFSTGKWYGEAGLTTTAQLFGLGEAAVNSFGTNSSTVGARTYYLYNSSSLYSILPGADTGLISGLATGGRLAFACDMDNRKLWLGYAASGDSVITWVGGGDPAAGTSPTHSFASDVGTLFPLLGTNGPSLYAMFGQAPLHTSATYHSAAGGYFRYAPPTGFKALCQRNLLDPAILNPSVAVAHRFEAGSGIAAAIASDRSGWSDWLEMFKRTDTTESWKVRFSDDSSNMLAFDTNGTKVAWSAPSAGTYLGVALRVGSTYGLVTGTYAGDNTSNKNISHSLGKPPTCGLVKNESTGTWYVWHTKMTGATYFTTLNSATPPAQSATNTPWGTGNWSSTQFMVTNNATNNLNASSNTYRYILFADISGLLALLGHTGNASADGALEYVGHKAQLQIEKDLAATTGFYVWSDKIDTDNVTGSYLLLNTNAGIATATGVDIVSNAIKHRSATLANASNAHMDISYARVSGKYSLAR